MFYVCFSIISVAVSVIAMGRTVRKCHSIRRVVVEHKDPHVHRSHNMKGSHSGRKHDADGIQKCERVQACPCFVTQRISDMGTNRSRHNASKKSGRHTPPTNDFRVAKNVIAKYRDESHLTYDDPIVQPEEDDYDTESDDDSIMSY